SSRRPDPDCAESGGVIHEKLESCTPLRKEDADMLNAEKRKTLLLLIPVILVLIGYVLYPTLRTAYESFFHNGVPSLQNYEDFFGSKAKANLQALWNSVWISLLSVLFSALIGVPLAYIFNRY